jgi:glycosyltransferase involved in cell wall biosynthesis
MDELISVVVPTYNRGRLLRECVENLEKQTYPNFEIIVVDDGSTDDTEQIMSELVNDHVIYHRLGKNQGACVARNTGVDLAKGDYIAFQDSDDLWENDKLERQMEYLKNEKLDVCFCSMRTQKKDGRFFVTPDRFIPDSQVMRELCKTSFISTQMIFGKKSCFLAERFDPQMPRLQDYDLMIRIAGRYKVGHLNEVLVHQRLLEDSITNNSEKLRRSVLLIGEKYKEVADLSYNLYVEMGYRNYFADYGFNSKLLFRLALKQQLTLKALALFLIPDVILRPVIRKKHGR